MVGLKTIKANATIMRQEFMRQEFPVQPEESIEIPQSHTEGEGEINFDDGMGPVPVPARITKENFSTVFGSTLPEGLSPDIFEDGGLKLDE